MAQWLVKDLSLLTGVSVRTLHYYDCINLLRPSVRLVSGYRIYLEKDLLRLQHIIALKFFGFGLSHIKLLLAGDTHALEHLSTQSRFLENKANALFETSKILESVSSDYAADQTISWKKIVKLIESYNMAQGTRKVWENWKESNLERKKEFSSDILGSVRRQEA